MKIETLAVHAGRDVDPATGAIASPIYLSTTFERDVDGAYPRGYMYTRNSNPNRQMLESGVAAFEGGAAAAAFSSGIAGASAIFQSLSPGDHVLVPSDSYYGVRRALQDVFQNWDLRFDAIDMTEPGAVQKSLRPETKLVWTETPSNPLFRIVDLAGIAEIARQAGALTVCDNTCGAVIQRPLDLGIDVVMHSTTKYFGGHCDVLGGVLVARQQNELFERVRKIQYTAGAVPSPFDCWLVLRGMQTLPWRMRGHCENAMKVSQHLAVHPAIERVHYPGLPNHPGHDIARRQMTMFGGMMSIEVKGGSAAAMRVAANTKIFIRGTSLGGVESLIEHRASIEGPGTTTPENLLRLSIGLENADDLIEDLDQALSSVD